MKGIIGKQYIDKEGKYEENRCNYVKMNSKTINGNKSQSLIYDQVGNINGASFQKEEAKSPLKVLLSLATSDCITITFEVNKLIPTTHICQVQQLTTTSMVIAPPFIIESQLSKYALMGAVF